MEGPTQIKNVLKCKNLPLSILIYNFDIYNYKIFIFILSIV